MKCNSQELAHRWLSNIDAEWSRFLHMPNLSKLVPETLDTRRQLNLAPGANSVEQIQAPYQAVGGIANPMCPGLPPRDRDLINAEESGKFLRLHPHFLPKKSDLWTCKGRWLLKEKIRNGRVKALHIGNFGKLTALRTTAHLYHDVDFIQAAFTVLIALFFLRPPQGLATFGAPHPFTHSFVPFCLKML